MNPTVGNMTEWYGTKNVAADAADYSRLFAEDKGGNVEARKSNYMTMVRVARSPLCSSPANSLRCAG